ncbi:MAG: hypothetical protein ACI9HH_003018 [Pseudomonadota bacterium]|jgi:hypothetical protein
MREELVMLMALDELKDGGPKILSGISQRNI